MANCNKLAGWEETFWIYRRLPADARFTYGKDAGQFSDLRLPSTSDAPHPIIVSLHGGFWRAAHGPDHTRHACAKLAQAGVASWNLEHRRVGYPGVGRPGTLDDALAGFEYLKTLAAFNPLDLKRAALMGFSAGGHLALRPAFNRAQPHSTE